MVKVSLGIIEYLVLKQWFKFNVIWRARLVRKRTLDRVQVVCPYGYQSATSANILVKLVLEIQKAIVRVMRQVDVSEEKYFV